MSKNQFIETFVSTFCANWCMSHYNKACFEGNHKMLESPPVKDAIHLANCAWNEYYKAAKNS